MPAASWRRNPDWCRPRRIGSAGRRRSRTAGGWGPARARSGGRRCPPHTSGRFAPNSAGCRRRTAGRPTASIRRREACRARAACRRDSRDPPRAAPGVAARHSRARRCGRPDRPAGRSGGSAPATYRETASRTRNKRWRGLAVPASVSPHPPATARPAA